MSQLFLYLALGLIAAVVVILFIGIYSLMKGGGFGERWSNKLMRLRVLTQALAILCLIVFAAFAAKH
jgi:hypothetical protein